MRRNPIGWVKAAVFLAALWPVFSLTWRALHDGLGANPIEFITHATGDWTIRFLIFTLAITPARKLLGQPWLTLLVMWLGIWCATLYAAFLWLTKSIRSPLRSGGSR